MLEFLSNLWAARNQLRIVCRNGPRLDRLAELIPWNQFLGLKIRARTYMRKFNNQSQINDRHLCMSAIYIFYKLNLFWLIQCGTFIARHELGVIFCTVL